MLMLIIHAFVRFVIQVRNGALNEQLGGASGQAVLVVLVD